MSVASEKISLDEKVRLRIAELGRIAPGSVGDMLSFHMIGYDADRKDVLMTCETMSWMRNSAGTLHGGMCATILDQAMGFVAHCLMTEEGTAPAVQMQVDYHRPLYPGEQVTVRVHMVSATKSFIRLTAEAFQTSDLERICLSGSGIYFHKTTS